MDEKYRVLKEHFGHDNFRDFQLEAVESILRGQDLLTILPTGGGKSLCYQLPTMLMDGLTVVITPLIALMQDQVAALKANNIAAAMVSSTQTTGEIKNIYSQIYSGGLKFLYVAPERLNPNFLSMLSQVKL
ncbi:MAG: DEAD/DEAH box helicase, partial [Campylobacterota bacterium]